MDIRSIKQSAKASFTANYLMCVVTSFLLGLLMMGTSAAAGSNLRKAGDIRAEQQLAGALGTLSPAEQASFFGIFFGAFSGALLISLLLRIFVFNPLQVGGLRFFRKNAAEQNPGLGVIGEGFGGYGHTFATLFLRDLFCFLWSLLFIVPGIIKAYSYMAVPYLIKDQPEVSATETLAKSRELMNGHKMDAFLLDLSFLGWFLLGMITCNLVSIFWTNPYHENARARFYLELLGE